LLLTACIVKNFDEKAKYYSNKAHQRLKATIKSEKVGYSLFMKTILFLLLATCFALLLAACRVENPLMTAENSRTSNETALIATDKTPVLVELFTSEG
jgi:hypothetical protein